MLIFFKCEFWLNDVVFLEHIVSGNEIFIDPKKVDVIVNWQQPKHVTKIRSVLGLVRYYKQFVEHISLLSISLA